MLKVKQGTTQRDLYWMYKNKFWEHYEKRDGAIYKDLAYYDHKDRIKMLNEFIFHCMDSTERITKDKKLYDKYKSLIDVNKRSIRFYCKLKKFCNKNKKIKGFISSTLKQNERKK
jgi:hypothetical protein